MYILNHIAIAYLFIHIVTVCFFLHIIDTVDIFNCASMTIMVPKITVFPFK
jgi:hypothetical protein